MHLLSDVQTLALIGLSRNKHKISHTVAKFLQKKGYTIIPINPFAATILKERSYTSITDISQEICIDVVIIFRPVEEIYTFVKAIIARGNIRTIWLPEGIQDIEAEKYAYEHGVTVISNFCIMRCFSQDAG